MRRDSRGKSFARWQSTHVTTKRGNRPIGKWCLQLFAGDNSNAVSGFSGFFSRRRKIDRALSSINRFSWEQVRKTLASFLSLYSIFYGEYIIATGSIQIDNCVAYDPRLPRGPKNEFPNAGNSICSLLFAVATRSRWCVEENRRAEQEFSEEWRSGRTPLTPAACSCIIGSLGFSVTVSSRLL